MLYCIFWLHHCIWNTVSLPSAKGRAHGYIDVCVSGMSGSVYEPWPEANHLYPDQGCFRTNSITDSSWPHPSSPPTQFLLNNCADSKSTFWGRHKGHIQNPNGIVLFGIGLVRMLLLFWSIPDAWYLQGQESLSPVIRSFECEILHIITCKRYTDIHEHSEWSKGCVYCIVLDKHPWALAAQVPKIEGGLLHEGGAWMVQLFTRKQPPRMQS